MAIDIYGDQLWVGDLLPLSPWLLVSLLENILATAGFQPFVVSLFQQLVQRNGIGQAAVLGHVTATYQLHYLVPCGPKFQEGAAIMFHQKVGGIEMAFSSPTLMATDVWIVTSMAAVGLKTWLGQSLADALQLE